MKFNKKMEISAENYNEPLPDRNHICFDMDKDFIMSEMAEGVKEAKIILKRMIAKDLYWTLLVTNLDDMNIRGKQLDFLWLASGQNYHNFIYNIEHPSHKIAEKVNIYSSLYGYVDRAVKSGATHLRLQNPSNKNLYISENEAIDYISKSNQIFNELLLGGIDNIQFIVEEEKQQ